MVLHIGCEVLLRVGRDDRHKIIFTVVGLCKLHLGGEVGLVHHSDAGGIIGHIVEADIVDLVDRVGFQDVVALVDRQTVGVAFLRQGRGAEEQGCHKRHDVEKIRFHFSPFIY